MLRQKSGAAIQDAFYSGCSHLEPVSWTALPYKAGESSQPHGPIDWNVSGALPSSKGFGGGMGSLVVSGAEGGAAAGHILDIERMMWDGVHQAAPEPVPPVPEGATPDSPEALAAEAAAAAAAAASVSLPDGHGEGYSSSVCGASLFIIGGDKTRPDMAALQAAQAVVAGGGSAASNANSDEPSGPMASAFPGYTGDAEREAAEALLAATPWSASLDSVRVLNMANFTWEVVPTLGTDEEGEMPCARCEHTTVVVPSADGGSYDIYMWGGKRQLPPPPPAAKEEKEERDDDDDDDDDDEEDEEEFAEPPVEYEDVSDGVLWRLNTVTLSWSKASSGTSPPLDASLSVCLSETNNNTIRLCKQPVRPFRIHRHRRVLCQQPPEH